MDNEVKVLTPEQWEKFAPVLQEMEKYRNLSEEEKEQIILQIVSAPYIDLMCDWAFKHVFGHNKGWLMMLLNDFLPERVVDLEYDDKELDLFSHDDKLVVMDVVCKTENGRRILVEMQKSEKKNFRSRMLYYGAGMFYKQLKSGEDYGTLMPVYVICFMNFTLRHEHNQLVYRYEVFEESSHERYEPDKKREQLLTWIYCELPRFAGLSGRNLSPVEQWFDILQNMRNFAVNPKHVDKRFTGILEACRQNRLPDVEQIQYVRAMISDREKQEIAEVYLERGIEQGIEQGRRDTIREFMAAGASKELIAAATGLSIEEIEALQ